MSKTKKNRLPALYEVCKEGSDDFYKKTFEGYFTQTEHWGIAVVATLTFVNGIMRGWKAYIGACDAHTEQEICMFVKRSGNKLGFSLARAFFKDPYFDCEELYDNGW